MADRRERAVLEALVQNAEAAAPCVISKIILEILLDIRDQLDEIIANQEQP